MSGKTKPEPSPASPRKSDSGLRWVLAIINLPWLMLLVLWLLQR